MKIKILVINALTGTVICEAKTESEAYSKAEKNPYAYRFKIVMRR